MIWRSILVGSALLGSGISQSAEEPVKDAPPAPLVASEFECWEPGTMLVIGGWTTNKNRIGYTRFFTVSEIQEVAKEKNTMRGRFRRVGDLDMSEYQRMQRMDNAAFLAAFSKLHEQQSGVDFEYWNEVKDGAVFYHDNDADGDGFHQPDISLPKDLLPGAIFRSFGKEMKVSGYEKKRPSPLGGCEAVLIDFSYAGEKIDGDDSHFYRSLNWYGRGLSTLGQQIVEFEDKADQKGRVMEESHLQRVIRPQAKAPEK